MSLHEGTRLGAYEITAQIGEGGMGQVYRATDTRLKRQVAIKILPPSVAGDPDRLARFQREAEVLAALNHPHIAAIHGLEESGGVIALVMELVEGEDLSERIAKGAIPVAEALAIARQMAEALEAAHEQGIIHRDLKPANIKVRVDGTVKVLDFGLAKALAPAGGGATADVTNSPTITSPAMTVAGMILGTAAYMSPEQARGRAVDRRADVWAFGCVLFEMLTATRAFPGEDVTDTLAAVVRAEPEWGLVPATVSPTLIAFLRRSLAKDPRQRIGDIRDFRLAIEGAFDTPASVTSATPPAPARLRVVPMAASALVAAALFGTAAWMLKPAPPAPGAQVARFVVPLGDGEQYTGGGRLQVAISPDGTQVAYVANRRIYLRSLSATTARPIPGSEITEGILNPVFSPDGRSIVFWSAGDRTLKTLAVTGGTPVTLCPAGSPLGISWDESGILFSQSRAGLGRFESGETARIMRVAATGGEPTVLVTAKQDEVIYGPQLLPGGEWIVFTAATLPYARAADVPEVWDKAQVVAQSLKSSERKTLVSGGSDGRYLATGSTASTRGNGHLVYALRGVLFAVPFDPGRVEVTGSAVTVLEGIRRATGGAAQFSVSSAGTLMFLPGPGSTTSASEVRLAVFDRKGGTEPLKAASGTYLTPRVSPDGTRVALTRDDGGQASIWIHELSGANAMRRLTFETQGRNRFPVWSPDGQYVTFQSDREGDPSVFRQRADSSTPAERLTKADEGESHIPDAWSPDGAHLLYNVRKRDASELWMLSLKDGKAARFGDVQSPGAVLSGATFSPDGRWVAYSSRGSRGTSIVYVQPFPPSGAKFQISKDTEDGHHAVWSADGTELIYVEGLGLPVGAVRVTTKPTFAFSEAQPLQTTFVRDSPTTVRTFDIMRDGRFLGFTSVSQDFDRRPDGTPASPAFQIVLNWFEELRAKVPTSP